MEGKPFMTVVNNRGERVPLELIDTIHIEEKQYVIVSEVGSDAAVAYRVEQKHGEKEYASIGDGPEFKMVLEEYNKIHAND